MKTKKEEENKTVTKERGEARIRLCNRQAMITTGRTWLQHVHSACPCSKARNTMGSCV